MKLKIDMNNLKMLWPMLKPYKKTLFLSIFLGALASLLQSALPQVFRMLMDEGWVKKDFSASLFYSLLVPGIWVLSSVFSYFQIFYIRWISEKVAFFLRMQLMKKYLKFKILDFSLLQKGSGTLISRMFNDINQVQSGVIFVAPLLKEPFKVIFSLAYLFYLDWRLVALLLLVFPLTLLIVKQLARSLRKYSKQSQNLMEGLVLRVKESMEGIRIVHAFNLQDKVYKNFKETMESFLKSRRKIVQREVVSSPLTQSFSSLGLGFVLIFISYAQIEGDMQISDFLVFIFATALLQEGLKKTQSSYIHLQQAIAAVLRVQDLQQFKEEKEESKESFPKQWQKITFKNVSVSYEEESWALKDIDLNISKGQTVALVGQSGGGKSTFVNLLESFLDPTKGEILFDNKDITNLDKKDLRNHMAFVSQDTFLFEGTVKENLTMGLEREVTDEEIHSACKKAQAHGFISALPQAYDSQVGAQGGYFSGGEKQRLSLARAFLRDASIFILDEPTSALDYETEAKIQKAINALSKEKTVFIISHRLPFIKHADIILFFENGKIVEKGTHEELMQMRSKYFHILES